MPATASALNIEAIPAVSAQVLLTEEPNKRGKPQGKPVFSGFTLQYTTPMNPATAGLAANYDVYALKSKSKLVPVSFIASLDAADNAATLTILAKATVFAKGGEIRILAAVPAGVSSQQGVLLSPSCTVFTIAPKAKSISLA